MTFRVLAGTPEKEVFNVTLSDPDSWKDVEADLSSVAAPSQQIVLRTESRAKDAVGFWAAPRILPGAQFTRPNVLMYVVCTLRPDHTSLYGYSRDTTPFLKKLGAEGVVFDDAQSQAPWTKPSVASMLTSLYAYTHGLVRDEDTIPKGAATLAEQMRAAGYVTASIVANPFAGRASGLDRGFDEIMEYPVVQRYRTDAVDRGTDSAAINRALKPWISTTAASRFSSSCNPPTRTRPTVRPPTSSAASATPATPRPSTACMASCATSAPTAAAPRSRAPR